MPHRTDVWGELLTLIADVTEQRPATQDVEREGGDQYSRTDGDERRHRKFTIGSSEQRLSPEDDDDGQQAKTGAQHGSGTGESHCLEGQQAHQKPSIGPMEAQGRLFTALCIGMDVGTESGEERRQEHSRKAKEQEHPFAYSCVVPGHLESVRDVVDEVVLPRGDPTHLLCNRPRLPQRRGGVRLQEGSIDQNIDLRDWQAFEDRPLRGAGGPKRRHDGVPERRGRNHHGKRHVEEVVEFAHLAAGEQRLRLREIGDTADRHPQDLGTAG